MTKGGKASDPNIPYWECGDCGFSNSKLRNKCVNCDTGEKKHGQPRKNYGRYGDSNQSFSGL